jgi:flagellar protein FlgJ
MKAVATQFEALFINQVLKSMRASLPKDGLFDSDQTRLYTSLMDEEMSQAFAKRGLGMADQILQQMAATGQIPKESVSNLLSPRQIASGISSYKTIADNHTRRQSVSLLQNESMSAPSAAKTRKDRAGALSATPPNVSATKRSDDTVPSHVRNFTSKMRRHASVASRETGIPAQFMLAQAALETGWGKKQMVGADGKPSYNLFGIKANHNWAGKTVNVLTTEFENGRMVKKVEKFRAYRSYAESFRDYANLMRENPRYRNVVSARDPMSFAYGLQYAGYATDPEYGSKLMRVINTVAQV